MFKHDDLNKENDAEENKDRKQKETNNDLHEIEENQDEKDRKDGKHEETNYLLDSRHSQTDTNQNEESTELLVL